MNVAQLEIELSKKSYTASSDYDLLVYAKAIALAKTGAVLVVSEADSLPPAAANEGKLYFIENIETTVWSNGVNWLRLLDKTGVSAQLWSWGASTGSGRLGDGTTLPKCSPVREISSSTNWHNLSTGLFHTSAIKTNGELWAWGANGNTQIGDGTSTCYCSPVREFCSATNWCQVSASAYNTAAIKTSGELWIWGYGGCGQLGNGSTTRVCSPVRELLSASDWCTVSLGVHHSIAIKTSGTLWNWGRNDYGQLSDGTSVNKCSPIQEICSSVEWCFASGGSYHTAAIKYSGELWSWGKNICGELGNLSVLNSCSPVREISSSTNWCSVDLANSNSQGLKTSGEIWGWGRNTIGTLGDGTTTTVCSPVREFCSATDWCTISLGTSNGAAVKTDGTIWSWGNNLCGKLGDGTTISSCSPVREISSSTNWCSVSVGNLHSAALKTNI